MNISRYSLVITLLSIIYALPCHVYATDALTGSPTDAPTGNLTDAPAGSPTDAPTGSPTDTDDSRCSELASEVDKKVCDYHLSAFEALIREKNDQISPATSYSTASPSASPIPETVKIIKISATTRLDKEVFETSIPTLFIFDAQSPGQEHPAVYELPLTVPDSGDDIRGVKSFQLPDNSAFVGNSKDIRPEFVIEGGIQNHYVMSAPNNDAVYYLANIEIDSRNPLDRGSSSVTAALDSTGKEIHKPFGVLELKGAGIFVADNIKVVLDPADYRKTLQPVKLGCTNFADGRGTEETFVYRFTDSEFDLLQGLKKTKYGLHAAISVSCYQQTGQVRLTMRNTTTVIFVPPGDPISSYAPGSGKLFSIYLWPRDNIMRFVGSSCNSVVDQFDNDLSISSADPSYRDLYMGDIYTSFCTEINMIQGAFGLKDRELAWGWILTDYNSNYGCNPAVKKTYRPRYASLSEWSKAGVEVTANCTMPTSTSITRVPYAIVGADALEKNDASAAGLTPGQIAGIGLAAVFVDQVITQGWFYLSHQIRQDWIRHTSQALAATLGVGLPVIQLMPKCISRLRGRSAVHTLLTEEKQP
ncbi:PT domain-containing protein [Endozoicomonas sp. ALB032]|uniref:PT domain-containing protein n=1 Tax=Endozoicomonas sp. ALB032 TaxID=3403082 RepID=UPI003BB4B7C7